MPAQILDLDPGLLAEKAWSFAPTSSGPKRTKVSWAASSSGCSAAFVSKDGLIATNHHCGYGAQAASTPENDYPTDGFLAAQREDELEAATTGSGPQLRRHGQVQQALNGIDDDEARAKAAEKKQNELVAACEKTAPVVRLPVSTTAPSFSFSRTSNSATSAWSSPPRHRQLWRRDRQLDVAAPPG